MIRSTRRSLLQMLSASSLLPLLPALTAAAQSPQSSAPATPGKAPDLTHCTAIPFASLIAHPSPSGASLPVLNGVVPTGEHIELHETTLNPGQMPHPPHQHRHEELILIREGTVDFLYGGASHTLTPGGVAYIASNEMHGLKNLGNIPAHYFVIAIGQEA